MGGTEALRQEITIVMTTWLPPGQEKIRAEAFFKALQSWEMNLIHDADIHLHVSDDGTNTEIFHQLITKNLKWDRGHYTVSHQQRHGVGASLNRGLKQAFKVSNIAMHAVDDWELLVPLDLRPWVDFMEDPNYDVGMLRFYAHPDLTGTFRFIPPHGWAVALDRHHYVFSFRPCLWHKRFFDALDYFREDVSAIECEQDFNKRLTNYPPAVEGERVWLALPEIWKHLDPNELSSVKP